MFEDNPMFSVNVKLWKLLSVLPSYNWRFYLFVVPIGLMNIMQLVYMFHVWGDFASFLLCISVTTGVFNALLRTCYVVINRDKFGAFMMEFDTLYREIKESKDVYAKGVLKQATLTSRKISIFNLSFCVLDITCTLLVPLLSGRRTHPFGVAIPGVDIFSFPIYQIVYILQVPTPLVITAMYMPFVNLFAAYAIFGKAMLIVLQQKLKQVSLVHDFKSENQRYEDLIKCIQYYTRISRYVKQFNALVTYIVFVEFLIYTASLCLMLFCLNIFTSLTEIVTIILYISTILYVLFTYYWLANELMTESLKISEAAYNMAWYQCSPRFRKTVLIFMIMAQKPLQITLGNFQPMTLETFQSLLNASYYYFTVLRGIYK